MTTAGNIITSWDKHSEAITSVREQVFLREQGIPADLDFDDNDAASTHVLWKVDGKPVATGRIQADGKIGRVAVLASFRNRGLGTAVVNALIQQASKAQLLKVYLNSQKSSIGFYEALGFTAEGEPFLEAGIEHIRMWRSTENR
jgi:predicted GNAT family N-acyltransferase